MPVDRDVSRRSFLRRALGAGVGLLSLEFVGASIAFTWPNITGGLGARIRIGTLSDILVAEPRFAQGLPFASPRAQSFLINVPAARALASGDEVVLRNPTPATWSRSGAAARTSAARSRSSARSGPGSSACATGAHTTSSARSWRRGPPRAAWIALPWRSIPMAGW